MSKAVCGKRHRVRINDENFYLMISEDGAVIPTVPRENARDQRELRKIVEELCEAITCIQRGESLWEEEDFN